MRSCSATHSQDRGCIPSAGKWTPGEHGNAGTICPQPLPYTFNHRERVNGSTKLVGLESMVAHTVSSAYPIKLFAFIVGIDFKVVFNWNLSSFKTRAATDSPEVAEGDIHSQLEVRDPCDCWIVQWPVAGVHHCILI